LKGNKRLPSEAEIGAEYSVSRSVVRQALLELERGGFIYRQRGKGTFVADQESLKHLSSKGTIENLIASAEGTRLDILDVRDVVPPAFVAKILGIEKKRKCQRVEAVRSSHKGPYAYANFFFPPRWSALIPWNEYNADLEVLMFIEGKINNRIYRASQTIGVALAGDIAARHLALKPQDPVMMIQRDYYFRDGSPLFVAITYNRPDRYEYKVELSRN